MSVFLLIQAHQSPNDPAGLDSALDSIAEQIMAEQRRAESTQPRFLLFERGHPAIE